jgi:ABC-2 type transport system permease protein
VNLLSLAADVRQYRELFVNLTQRELKGKYKRTVLGQLWSLANPLALMLVYTLVFAFIIRIGPERGDPSGLDVFPLWLLCGLLPWIFFSGVVTQGMGSLIANESLIKKVYFPRNVLVFSTGASIAVNWAIEMLVLVIALVIAGAWGIFVWLPFVVVLMALLAAFSIGTALLFSIANVYFRDTQYFVTILLQLGLYLTPVIYPMSLVEQQSERVGGLLGTPITFADIYSLNPMQHFMGAFRSLLYDNTWPQLDDAIACVVWAAALLTIGWLVFRRSERRLAEIL